MRHRRVKYALRCDLALWQRSTVILLAVLLIFAATALWMGIQWRDKKVALEEEVEHWHTKYTAAHEVGTAAVTRLGAMRQEFDAYIAQVEQDRAAEEAERAQRMAAYEAVGMYRYIGECTLTAYCCESKDNPHICGTGTGLTASGLPVAPGMVAVDPSIIPLGSTVIINGISYLAADTGVTGYHVDIAIQTHEEAEKFGISSAEVWIIPPGGDGDGR